MTALRNTLARSVVLKNMFHALQSGSRTATCHLSPQLLARLRYRAAWGRWPDLERPTTFDEKLLWLNFYWRDPLKTECGDKYTMRGYVERQGMPSLLPRLYGVFDSVDAIDFQQLPERCVLKCTHGCKCNVFCRNKVELDTARVRQDLTRWLATDYSKILGELHYAGMKPRIICEELLDEGTGRLPADYKVYCFNGQPCWILCCTDREPNGKGLRAFLDADWKPVKTYLHEAGTLAAERPAGLPELLRAAQQLSVPFPFVRMDFYCIHERVVLGEMTFTPNACINSSYTVRAQQEMGRRLELPHHLVR